MSGIWLPVLAAALYLAILAGISEWVERRPGLHRLAEHPITFGLALGVYATSWSFYGSLGYADGFGYVFLAVHVGAALACVATPVLWRPLARVVQRHRLGSVADLLAFRYQSQAVGVGVTLFLLAALLPYLSLQLRAIAEGAAYLASPDPPPWLGLVYAGLLSLFAAGLGVRYAEPRRRRPGLVATLAIESLVKLGALMVVGVVAIVAVFGGWEGFSAVMDRPEVRHHMFAPLREGPWAAVMVVSFVAMFMLPRQFHVAFVERGSERGLRHVVWVVPLLLLLLNLPVPVLYWAGREVLGPSTPADLYVLGVAQHSGTALVAFLGGVSASSAMVLVSAIALSGMVVNHLVLPLRRGRATSYERLVSLRRAVMAALVGAGFGLHLVLPREGFLIDLGLVSFIAVLQLVPGVVGTLWWPRATRRGLAWGLAGGFLAWVAVTVVPLLAHRPVLGEWLAALGVADDPRSDAVWISLGTNVGLFVVGSLWRPVSADERAAAEACRPQRRSSPLERLPALDVERLRERLAAALGPATATAELQRALGELGLAPDERRPAELRRLGLTVQRNVAELVGPLRAAVLVGRGSAESRADLAAMLAELRVLDELGEAPGERGPVPALWAERMFERVLRYLARVLDDLPVGVCAVDRSGEIAVWNHDLAQITGIPLDRALGTPLASLPAPWGELLSAFAAGDEPMLERSLPTGGPPRIVRLRRSGLDAEPDEPSDHFREAGDPMGPGGGAIVVEDLTERRALHAQAAHQDRLASVGRLAAGVAHELRNPLTGVIMLARNLSREPHADDAVERLQLIVSESQRIERIVRTLLTFSGPEPARRTGRPEAPVAVEALVADAIRLVAMERREDEPRWALAIEPGLSAPIDAPRLMQVLVNLLSNARDASAPGEPVMVRAFAHRDGPPEHHREVVVLEVEDRGEGIPSEIAAHVFEPFVTTKDPGKGTGLGLAVTHRLVRDHGGTASWRPAEPRGTVFRVELPVRAQDGA